MTETTNHPRTAVSFAFSPVLALASRARRHRLALSAGAAIAFMALAPGAYPQDSQSNAAVVACGSSISTCGCTITRSGFFQVTAPLLSSQGLTALNGCVDIKASKVTLNTGKESSRGHKNGAFSITGPGGTTPTGIGIHILKGSNNDFIELPSDVDGWDVGILVEGNNNIVEDFGASENGTAGFEINEGKNNNINDFNSGSNKNYGGWIRGGSNNQINCSNTDDNGNVGVFIGCSSNGPIDAACSGKSPVSKSNKIFDHSAGGNGHFGVAIDSGNTGNDVSDVDATGNGTEDMMDENSDCDSDLWYFNSFSNAMPSCVD